MAGTEVAEQEKEYVDEELSKQCKDGRFPSPFKDPRIKDTHYMGRDKPRAIVEIRMYVLSNAMREKQDWQKKRLDPTITAKWKEEIRVQEESVLPQHRLSEAMVSEPACCCQINQYFSVNADRLCSG